MISRSHRFHGYTSLRRAYRHGAHIKSEGLSLRYFLNPRRRTYRCAVVVSKKVHKSAVVRNRIRRRIYETMRTEGTAVTRPYDLVFTVLDASLAEVPIDKLQTGVIGLLAKAGALDREKP